MDTSLGSCVAVVQDSGGAANAVVSVCVQTLEVPCGQFIAAGQRLRFYTATLSSVLVQKTVGM